MDITPDQAREALGSVDGARRRVADDLGLPRIYWWAMAVSWVVLGVIGAFAPPWVTTVATIVFGVVHSTIASRLFDGRRASTHVRPARSVADRRIPLIVIAMLLTAVVVTVGAALALDADGTRHPSIWAAVFVAAILGFGGPQIFDDIRGRVGA
ncbi:MULTISPECIES: hypothetical protein [Gordonia]|uniref:Uncharacterized protein n=1 Tax=Gordonia sputi NBRC 100414 TaxID=1089453 RepID=H5U770_9ACTN|nr:MULTISPECIES: hypothetical protein [Gordonia]NKY92121.1 hypothetical protein [Gordonia sputi]OBA33705.1 hypothetical protein A5766_11390 [Gordonia sp. 852002-51296_SCH5728562-b]GAB41558.1 hypothetical protein GOSPT_135_00200 [Gordonia sputi NBRC 100414]